MKKHLLLFLWLLTTVTRLASGQEHVSNSHRDRMELVVGYGLHFASGKALVEDRAKRPPFPGYYLGVGMKVARSRTIDMRLRLGYELKGWRAIALHNDYPAAGDITKSVVKQRDRYVTLSFVAGFERPDIPRWKLLVTAYGGFTLYEKYTEDEYQNGTLGLNYWSVQHYNEDALDDRKPDVGLGIGLERIFKFDNQLSLSPQILFQQGFTNITHDPFPFGTSYSDDFIRQRSITFSIVIRRTN